LIPRTFTKAFFYFTTPCSNEIDLLIYAKNPYPGLLRLMEHSDINIVSDGICSIYSILLSGANTTPETSHHPHYDTM
jgi:hypothetical protein